MHKGKKIRFCSFFVSIIIIGTLFSKPLSVSALYELPANTKLDSSTGILVSLGPTQADDMMLFEKEADTKRSPAALIRLMVGVTAIKIIRDKNIDIDTATGEYTIKCFNAISGTGLTVANMKIGEVWTVRDLLSMSMIQTAADACVTLAVTLGGSQSQFVAEMNALAKEIGCENTSFSNVTGIDSINQYVSARDVYRIMRYGMDYPEYEPLLSATQYTCHPVSKGEARTLPNTNYMLRSSSRHYYSPMSFGKTGFTDPAGYCIASVARDSGYEYLCVVLGAPKKNANGKSGAHYIDTKTLFRWAFNNFTYKTLLNKNQPITQLPVKLAWNKDTVTLVPENNFAATVADDLDPATILKKTTLVSESVNAPVEKGKIYGKVELFINIDQKIGEVNLVANESVNRSEILSAWDNVQKFISSPWFYAGLILLAMLLIGYIILNIVHNRKRRRNRMKKVKKYR